MGKKLAPLALVFPIAGVIAWIQTGDWTWAVYGLLALLLVGALGATADNFRRTPDDERSEP